MYARVCMCISFRRLLSTSRDPSRHEHAHPHARAHAIPPNARPACPASPRQYFESQRVHAHVHGAHPFLPPRQAATGGPYPAHWTRAPVVRVTYQVLRPRVTTERSNSKKKGRPESPGRSPLRRHLFRAARRSSACQSSRRGSSSRLARNQRGRARTQPARTHSITAHRASKRAGRTDV